MILEKTSPQGTCFCQKWKKQVPRGLVFSRSGKNKILVSLCSQPFGSSDLRSGGCLDALHPQWRPDSSAPQLRAYINYSMHHAVTVQHNFTVKGALNKKPCVLETMEVATGTSVRHVCRVFSRDPRYCRLKKQLGGLGDSVVTDSISPASSS